MKSRIRGGDAARAAVATTERLPVPLQATDLVGPFQPIPEIAERKKPPRVRKPSPRHDVIHAPTTDLDAHRAMLRTTFETFSAEFADTMMGKRVHIHPGDQGVVGIVNHDEGQKRGGDEK